MIDEPNELAKDLYEQRLLVFMENIEKGTFYQVLLNEKQFKAVSDSILVRREKSPELKDGMEFTWVDMEDERAIPADTFIGMQSITDKKDPDPNRMYETEPTTDN